MSSPMKSVVRSPAPAPPNGIDAADPIEVRAATGTPDPDATIGGYVASDTIRRAMNPFQQSQRNVTVGDDADDDSSGVCSNVTWQWVLMWLLRLALVAATFYASVELADSDDNVSWFRWCLFVTVLAWAYPLTSAFVSLVGIVLRRYWSLREDVLYYYDETSHRFFLVAYSAIVLIVWQSVIITDAKQTGADSYNVYWVVSRLLSSFFAMAVTFFITVFGVRVLAYRHYLRDHFPRLRKALEVDYIIKEILTYVRLKRRLGDALAKAAQAHQSKGLRKVDPRGGGGGGGRRDDDRERQDDHTTNVELSSRLHTDTPPPTNADTRPPERTARFNVNPHRVMLRQIRDGRRGAAMLRKLTKFFKGVAKGTPSSQGTHHFRYFRVLLNRMNSLNAVSEELADEMFTGLLSSDDYDYPRDGEESKVGDGRDEEYLRRRDFAAAFKQEDPEQSFTRASRPPDAPTDVDLDNAQVEEDSAHWARRARKLFDTNGDGHVSREEMRERTLSLIMERQSVVQSMDDANNIVLQLERVFFMLACLVLVFVIMAIFEVDIQEFFLTLTSIFVLIAVLAGSFLKSFVDAVVFLLVQHPYDVGDAVMLNDGSKMYVTQMGLLTTEFSKWDGEVTYYHNAVLSSMKIVNLRRSKDMMQELTFRIDANTPVELINELERRFQHEVATNFVMHLYPDIQFIRNNLTAGDGGQLEMLAWVSHRGNFQLWTRKWIQRSKLVEFIQRTCQELGIRFSRGTTVVDLHQVAPPKDKVE